MRPNKVFLALSIILLITFLTRLHNADKDYLWQDEADYALNALNVFKHGYPTPTHNGFPLDNMLVTFKTTLPWNKTKEFTKYDNLKFLKPFNTYQTWLPFYLMAPPLHYLDNVQLAARLPGIVIGTSLSLIAFFIFYRIIGIEFSLFLALALGLDPFLINLSKEAYYHIYSIFFFIIIWYLIVFSNEMRKYQKILFYLLSFQALFHTNIKLAFVAFLFWTIWTILYKNKKNEWISLSINGFLCAGWILSSSFLDYFGIIRVSQLTLMEFYKILESSFTGQNILASFLILVQAISCIAMFISKNKRLLLSINLPILISFFSIFYLTPFQLSYKRVEILHFLLLINFFVLSYQLGTLNKWYPRFCVITFFSLSFLSYNEQTIAPFKAIINSVNNYNNDNGNHMGELASYIQTNMKNKIVFEDLNNLVLYLYYGVETFSSNRTDEKFMATGAYAYAFSKVNPLNCDELYEFTGKHCHYDIVLSRKCPFIDLKNWVIYDCSQ